MPQRTISRKPRAMSRRARARSSFRPKLRLGPRTEGMMQKVQRRSQPSWALSRARERRGLAAATSRVFSRVRTRDGSCALAAFGSRSVSRARFSVRRVPPSTEQPAMINLAPGLSREILRMNLRTSRSAPAVRVHVLTTTKSARAGSSSRRNPPSSNSSAQEKASAWFTRQPKFWMEKDGIRVSGSSSKRSPLGRPSPSCVPQVSFSSADFSG